MRLAHRLEVAESRPETAATVARICIMQDCSCGMLRGRSTCRYALSRSVGRTRNQHVHRNDNGEAAVAPNRRTACRRSSGAGRWPRSSPRWRWPRSTPRSPTSRCRPLPPICMSARPSRLGGQRLSDRPGGDAAAARRARRDRRPPAHLSRRPRAVHDRLAGLRGGLVAAEPAGRAHAAGPRRQRHHEREHRAGPLRLSRRGCRAAASATTRWWSRPPSRSARRSPPAFSRSVRGRGCSPSTFRSAWSRSAIGSARLAADAAREHAFDFLGALLAAACLGLFIIGIGSAAHQIAPGIVVVELIAALVTRLAS